jgi:hypothetical protein
MSSLRSNHGKTAAVEMTDSQGLPSPNGGEKFDDTGNPVAEKYKGTDADRHDMAVMGNRQVLRVWNLSLICSNGSGVDLSAAKLQLYYYAGLCIDMCS